MTNTPRPLSDSFRSPTSSKVGPRTRASKLSNFTVTEYSRTPSSESPPGDIGTCSTRRHAFECAPRRRAAMR